MIIASVSMDKELLGDFYKRLSEVPANLIPDSISDGELDKQFPISLKLLQSDEVLPVDSKGGYFLHAPDAKYDVSISDKEIKLFIEFTFDENAKLLSKQIARLPISYAYACRFEERKHQNRIKSKKKYGIHETWVGRDYRQYLPGLYWLNLIPKSLLEKHGVPEGAISSLALSSELIDDRNYLVQLYSSSDGWQERTVEVDTWREMTHGVFHKALAQQALDDAKTFMESSDATGEWK